MEGYAMAEILGLGITHYPLLSAPDEHLSSILKYMLEDPSVPAERKDPANWPALMREEWGNDEGVAAAAPYRAALLRGLREARAALDAFAPDALLIWGDDQYENFKEDGIPPFCLYAYDDLDVQPWRHISAVSLAGRPNVWGEPAETTIRVRGNREAAIAIASATIEEGVDLAYAYRPLHYEGLAHAFLNAILYLDYDRRGFPYPVIPMTINCYGRRVVSRKGSFRRSATIGPEDPPSPAPSRCFDVGRAIARACSRLPYRIALVASSSWSHAFLTDHTHRLMPDTAADHRLYERMRAGDLAAWRNVDLATVEHAGQQEMLNWFALAGAMHELGAELAWSDFVETCVYTSNKVTAIYQPVAGRV
jgi:hypothetical protein